MAMKRDKGYLSMWVLINDDLWMCSLKGAARRIAEDEWTTEPKNGSSRLRLHAHRSIYLFLCNTVTQRVDLEIKGETDTKY